MKRFKLTDLQANAILEMQLRRLAALERKKIETEYKEITALIKELEGLLKSPKRMREVVSQELLRVKAEYGDRRRTQIVSLKARQAKKGMLTADDLLPTQTTWVSVNEDGLVSRTHDDKPPRLSGTEAPWLLVKAQTTDILYLVSERGLSAATAVHTLPEAEKLSDGSPFNKVTPLREDQLPITAFVLPSKRSEFPEDTCVLTVTKGGMLKKSLISELPGASAQTFTLAKVNEGDALGWVMLTDGKKEVALATAQGFGIRFSEEDVRPMGLVAAGVNGMKLGVGDEVIGAQVLPATGELFLVGSDGRAKRLDQKDFPSQGRYGRGVKLWDLVKGNLLAGMAMGKGTAHVTLHLRKAAAKQTRFDEAQLRKRAATRGDVVVEVKPGDAVIGMTETWTVEKFVEAKKEEEKKEVKKKEVAKVVPKKKAVPVKKPAKAKKK